MLIQGGKLLNFETPSRHEARDVDIRVDGAVFTEIGAGLTPLPGEQVVDARNKIIIPGLVNAHLHSQEALYKGRYDNLPLELWMLYAYPVLGARSLSPEFVYLRTMLVGIESIRNGVTTVVDDVIELPAQIPEQLAAVFRAYDELGLRANVSGHVINRSFADSIPRAREVLEPDVLAAIDKAPLVTEKEYLDYSEDAFRTFHGKSGRLRYVLAPSGPQRCTESLMQAMSELARKYEAQYHIHVLETKMQAVTGHAFYGQTMTQYLARIGVLDRHTTFAHGVWVSDEDVEILAETGACVSHNPIANLKLGAGIAPYTKMLEAGVTVGLGSDGICNGSARLTDVIRTAALLHKVHDPDFERWPGAAHALYSATTGGARTCVLGDTIGSVSVGKAADFVMYDLDSIPFTPFNDITTHLAFSEDGSSLWRVYVAGECLYDTGTITRVDETELLASFRELAAAELQEHLEVEKQNSRLYDAFLDVYKWSASQPVGLTRYSSDQGSSEQYGFDSRLYRV